MCHIGGISYEVQRAISHNGFIVVFVKTEGVKYFSIVTTVDQVSFMVIVSRKAGPQPEIGFGSEMERRKEQ
jgi:hypothetical protein